MGERSLQKTHFSREGPYRGLFKGFITHLYMKFGNEGDSGVSINRVIQLSADLGYYIGDAHVPLHTTSYNFILQRTVYRSKRNKCIMGHSCLRT